MTSGSTIHAGVAPCGAERSQVTGSRRQTFVRQVAWRAEKANAYFRGIDVDVAEGGRMDSRLFVDSRGVTWRVFEVKLPSLDGKTSIHRDSWLAFVNHSMTRRLVPIPEAWRAAPNDELERMCARASPSL